MNSNPHPTENHIATLRFSSPVLKRRSFLKASATLAIGGAISRAWTGLGADAPAKVRLATLAPVGTSSDRALRQMGEKWRKAGVALTVFNGAGMGGEPDIIRRMRVGQIQAAALTAGGLARIEPGVGCLQNMPLVFRSLDELVYVRTKLFPVLQKRMLAKDFYLLFLTDAGWVRFFSKIPGKLPDDFKPTKMFAEAENKDYTDIMRAAGFRPVPLEYGDILTGLTAGNMIEALHPHLHPIGPEGYLSPLPGQTVIQPPAPPVERVADDAQRTHDGSPNDDAKPDKDRANHESKTSR